MDGPLHDVDERLRRGDPAGALDRIRAVREEGRDHPWLDLLEARARWSTGRPRDALRLVAAAAAAPHPELRARAALWWGRFLAAEGDVAGARARTGEALAVTGGLCERERLSAEADLAELDAREGAPDAEPRLLAAARGLDARGDPLGAARELLRLADRRLARGQHADADRLLAEVADRVAPTDEPGLLVPVWERRAEAAIGLREPSRALLLARRAIARSPPDDEASRARLWGLVGRAHAANGDLEGARMAHRRGAEIAERTGGSGTSARLDEAATLLALGRRPEARELLAGAASTRPSDPLDAVHAALSLVAAEGVMPSAAFAEHLRRIGRWTPEPTARTPRLLAALDRAAETCTDLVRAGQGGGRALARAARVRAIVQRIALDRELPAEAARQGHLLHELGSLGAPIPAGPFDLVRRLGSGLLGEVWRGRHHDRRVPVAVKVSRADPANPEAAGRFLAAVRALASLDHPNIVRVIGAGTLGPDAEAASHGELTSGSPWFAMELADGGTLGDRVGPMPWSEVRTVVQSLLDALAHAHARGVLHLDLRRSNVLLRTEDGRTGVLLSDFGLSRLVSGPRALGGVAGSPTTAAPEQLRDDDRDVGPWTDLYALGALTVELLTGRPAFDVGASFAAQRDAHLRTPWRGLPAEVRAPPGLDAWLSALLAKAPGDRFPRAADAAHALGRAVDGVDDDDGGAATDPFVRRVFTLSQHTLDEDDRDRRARIGPERPAPSQRPPIPVDWRPLVDRAPGTDFADVAPTAFGLAPVPLVGREAERDALWSELVRISDGGDPVTIAITGPTGIGRSALARWLCERAHELGAATVLDADEGPDGRRGLGALVERHLRLRGLPPDEAVHRVEAALPELPSWAAEDLTAIATEDDRALPSADRVFAVAAWIAAAAARRPVILRLARDGAADPEQDTLRRLLARERAPVLCVVTTDAARDGERELALGPLPDEATGALLDALLPLAPPARRAVQRAVGGHPGLAVAVVGDLLARDALVRGAQTWELRPGEAARLPAAVLAAWGTRLEARLAGAPPPLRTALGAMALLGDRLDGPRLQSVTDAVGSSVDALRAAFPDLIRAGAAAAPGFVHPAVRTILIDLFVDLMAAEAAVAAVELHPDGCEVLRAQLLVRAGRMFEAPPALLDAAGRLLEDGDPDEALALLDRRAEILGGLGQDPSGADQVPDALLRARIAHEQGRPEAGTLLAIASVLAERHEAWVALGESLLWRADSLLASGAPVRARRELLRATEAFTRGGDAVGTARALDGAARLAIRVGELDVACAILRRALDRLDPSARSARAAVNASLAAARRQLDDLDGAEAALADAHEDLEDAPAAVRAEVAATTADLARDRGVPAHAERWLLHALSLVPWHDVARVHELQTRRALAALADGRTWQARRLLDGLPDSRFGRLCQLVLAARADDAAWEAAWAAVADALDDSDRDVAWLFDAAGRRAAADGRRERAARAFAAGCAVYRRRGLTRHAEEVERRLAEVDPG